MATTQPADIDFTTLDLLPYGVIVLDAQGTVLYYNDREQEIAGRRREAVLGRNFFAEIAPCTQVQAFQEPFREALRAQARLPSFHFRFPFPERARDVEITLTGFRHQDAALCLVSVSDVTEEEEIRARILQSERLREMGEVAAGVAHNFNNLLMVVLGNLDMGMRSVPEGHPARVRLERAITAAQQGTQVVSRIMASARQKPEASASQALVDLNAVAAQAVSFAQEHASGRTDLAGTVTLEARLSPGLPSIRADASELGEVLLNLLRNAIDAMPQGGSATVSTRAEAGGVRVEVADTGAGMSADVKEKLFRPLFTTKGDKGTGLGLATCWAIVRRHGGRIDVSSEPGQGSRFTVVLPLTH